jgi:hypothetical protein
MSITSYNITILVLRMLDDQPQDVQFILEQNRCHHRFKRSHLYIFSRKSKTTEAGSVLQTVQLLTNRLTNLTETHSKEDDPEHANAAANLFD